MDALTPPGADPLTDLLNGVRTTGAVFNRSELSGAWAVRFEDGSPLAIGVLLAGTAWITLDGAEPVRLVPGDVAVLSGGAPYVMASSPDTEPDVNILPGGRCVTTSGEDGTARMNADGGNTAEQGGTVLVNGLYTVQSGAPGRLLAALPQLAVIHAADRACPVSQAAGEQITSTAPGQQVLLDRMLDLMLITALRAWFTRPDAPVPAWYQAHADPVVGHALRLLHSDLAHPWTVDALASKTGVSRAALARRFTTLVGQPPMTYLREQRLARAADLLGNPDTTIGAIAHQVGFANAFALSTAFKKTHGISPSEHRTAQTAEHNPRATTH
ncbi:AraC family transcriptional regulator [Actinomadura sp. 6N118]|uniref:AraC family transcriptional regulator n=1 Tax=Actinomadura sp. 6N118 TaxID=3375151 RepID=UPI0037B536C5